MTGNIRTKQCCPKCKGRFKRELRGFLCPKCLTVPTRYYIDIYWPGYGKLKIYSGKDGHVLDSYDRTVRLLETIRYQIDQHVFEPTDYIQTRLKVFRFKSYAELWLGEYKKRLERRHIAPSYYKEVKRFVLNYFVPYFGIGDIRDVRSVDIKNFAHSLPEHLKIKTQNNILAVLHKFFRDAADDGYIGLVPKFPIMAVPETYRSWIDETTQDVILEKIPVLDRPIIMFLMRQGVRPGEARALQWRDIDIRDETVVIRRAFSLNVCREFTKTKHIRVLPLDTDVKDMLRSLPVPMNDNDFVFKFRGRHYSESRARKVWNSAVKELGLKISLYEGTRHSIASQAVNRGVDHRIVGKFLGHKNPKQTERYAHVKTQTLKIVMRPQTGPKKELTSAKILILKGKKS